MIGGQDSFIKIVFFYSLLYMYKRYEVYMYAFRYSDSNVVCHIHMYGVPRALLSIGRGDMR
jgi:hypothetical protein